MVGGQFPLAQSVQRRPKAARPLSGNPISNWSNEQSALWVCHHGYRYIFPDPSPGRFYGDGAVESPFWRHRYTSTTTPCLPHPARSTFPICRMGKWKKLDGDAMWVLVSVLDVVFCKSPFVLAAVFFILEPPPPPLLYNYFIDIGKSIEKHEVFTLRKIQIFIF